MMARRVAIWRSPAAQVVLGLFCFVIWPGIAAWFYTTIKADEAAQRATRLQAQTTALQAQVEELTTSPFTAIAAGPVYRVTPPAGPQKLGEVLPAHPLDDYSITYTVTTSRPVQMVVTRSFTGAFPLHLLGVDEKLPAGTHQFTINVQIPCDLPFRYNWEWYFSTMFEPGHAYEPPPLPGFHVFTVDADKKLPRVIKGHMPDAPARPASPGPPACPAAASPPLSAP